MMLWMRRCPGQGESPQLHLLSGGCEGVVFVIVMPEFAAKS